MPGPVRFCLALPSTDRSFVALPGLFRHCLVLSGAALFHSAWRCTAQYCTTLPGLAQTYPVPLLSGSADHAMSRPALSDTRPCPDLSCAARSAQPCLACPVSNDPMQHIVQMTCCSKIKSIFHSALSISSLCIYYSEVISLQNMLQKNVLSDPGGAFRTAPPPPKKEIQCGLCGLKK